MHIHSETLMHKHEDIMLQNYIAFDKDERRRRPAILIAPDWSGLNDFAKAKAHSIAEMGMIGIAADVYGFGKTGQTHEEKSALMQPFMHDRELLRQRMRALISFVKDDPRVDPDNVFAIGFCFGGLCVLDLARSGADLKGVVSFHGLLNPPERLSTHKIMPSILILHGHDDPMVAPKDVQLFEEEMTQAQADWQVHVYGNTQHAFTNPHANDTHLGLIYSDRANRRSWELFKQFIETELT